MNFEEYVVGIIAIAVYLICVILHSVNWVNNKYLPLIAGVLGILFNSWYNWGFSFEIFIGGLASGLSAVGIDQIIEQFKGDSTNAG